VVFRDLCYDTPVWVDTFAEMAAAGFEFGLADHLLAEVTDQWTRGAFTGAQYRQAVTQAERFISSRLPVVPGKVDLAGLCGYLEDEEQAGFDGSLALAWLRQAWRLLAEARSVADLIAGREYDHDDHRYRVSVRPGAAESALEVERERWKDHIKSYDALPPDSVGDHGEELLIGMRRSVDGKVALNPPLSVRLDLAILHMFRQVRLRNRDRDRYNPDSKKKRNDGVDFNMAYYTGLS
jgi:hypothetical protein